MNVTLLHQKSEKMKAIASVLFFVSVLNCMSFSTSKTDDEKKTSKASYYHDKFNGRRTASGEIFQNTKFTAAHRTLPFGTKVLVKNIKNGKEVIVEINDRGPFHKSRALDLSKAAFTEIADIRSGVVSIEYEIIED